MNILNLKYFKTSIDVTPFEHNEDVKCYYCNKNNLPQIELDGSTTIIGQDSDQAESVCLGCLLEKKYAFEQKVEGGSLTAEGVKTESEIYPYLKDSNDYIEDLLPKEKQLLAMSTSQIEDLMYTPPFRAYQGAYWLSHCNDFMTFIGTWEHIDFTEKSANGNAEEYFFEILDNWNGDDFYEKQFDPNKSEYASSVFYAFECQCCKQYRGYVE